MTNHMAIGSLCEQIKIACERIQSMTASIEQFDDSNLEEVFISLRLDELEHVQVLALRLTDLIAQGDEENTAVNADEGGVFAAGELSGKPVDKTLEKNADCDVPKH